MTSLLTTILIGCLVGFSLILLVVSLVSYRRTKNARLLLVSAAFFIFFIKGIFLVAGAVFALTIQESSELLVMVLLNLVILLLLYLAIAIK